MDLFMFIKNEKEVENAKYVKDLEALIRRYVDKIDNSDYDNDPLLLVKLTYLLTFAYHKFREASQRTLPDFIEHALKVYKNTCYLYIGTNEVELDYDSYIKYFQYYDKKDSLMLLNRFDLLYNFSKLVGTNEEYKNIIFDFKDVTTPKIQYMYDPNSQDLVTVHRDSSVSWRSVLKSYDIEKNFGVLDLLVSINTAIRIDGDVDSVTFLKELRNHIKEELVDKDLLDKISTHMKYFEYLKIRNITAVDTFTELLRTT